MQKGRVWSGCTNNLGLLCWVMYLFKTCQSNTDGCSHALHTGMCWTSPFVVLGVSGLFSRFYSIFDGKILLANTVDLDQTPHYVASDLGMYCLPISPLRVSR